MPDTEVAHPSDGSKFVLDFVLDRHKPPEAIHELAPGVLLVNNRHNLLLTYFDMSRWEPQGGISLTFESADGVIGILSLPEGSNPLEYAKRRLKPRNRWFDQPKKLEL